MQLVIVGAGKIGRYLADLLMEERHDVIIVDKDAAVCKQAAEELDTDVIQGDGTDPKVLEKLDMVKTDALVALTGSDETNMVVSLVAKELGATQVATRIEKIEYDERVLKKLGIDIVIHPQAAAAGYIAELLTNPEVLDLAFISRGHAKILELKVRGGSKMAGKKVSEIEKPAGSAIIALVNKEEIEIPAPETKIEEGDTILVLAKSEVAEQVKKMVH